MIDRFFSIIGLICIVLANSDPCTHSSPDSFCLNSGMCSPPVNKFCVDAYIHSSAGMLRPLNEGPHTPFVTRKYLELAIHITDLRRDRLQPILPFPIGSNPAHRNFMEIVGNISRTLSLEFPYIYAPLNKLRDLVAASEQVATLITETSLGLSDNARAFAIYGRLFMGDKNVASLTHLLRVMAQYILSADEPVKTAIIANMVPIMHAWTRMMENLQLPPPFMLSCFQELLSQVSRFDPLYEEDEVLKPWTLILSPLRSSFVLPLMVSDSIDEFPLSVLETLLIDDSPPSIAYMDAIIRQLTLAIPMRFHPKIAIVRSALFYLLNFPGILEEHRAYFCDQSRLLWPDMLGSLTAPQTELMDHSAMSLIDLFRVCPREILSLQDRVSRVLPIVLAGNRIVGKSERLVTNANGAYNFVSILSALSKMEILSLRGNLQLRFRNPETPNESQNSQILNLFVSQLFPNHYARGVRAHDHGTPQHRPGGLARTIIAFGQSIALLVLEGDPDGLLQSLLTNGTIPNLYANSFYVRKGFCMVLECNVFETVFLNSEIPQMLEILKNQNHNILKPTSAIIAIA